MTKPVRRLCGPAVVVLLLMPGCRSAQGVGAPLKPESLPCDLVGTSTPTAASSTGPDIAPPVTLIRGATVWTATGSVLKNTDVLLRDGRIAEVGAGIATPDGARVIDAKGKHVTPGMVDPHSHMGVYPVPSLRAHADGNEVVKPISAEVAAEDGFWPQDPSIPRALAAGVTTAHMIPGSANLIGGRGIVVKLRPALSAARMRFTAAPPTLKMACGENPKRVYRERGGPFTRMGSVARLRAMFIKAQRYQQEWKTHRTKRARWEQRLANKCEKKGSVSRQDEDLIAPPPAPKRDLGLETLVEVMEGKVKVHWHCYRADEMLRMMRVAEEFGFTVQAFHHAVEAYKIRNDLKARGTATVSWVNWWGFKVEAYDAVPENIALVHAAGALSSLHSDSPRVIQRYNQEGALAYFRGKQMGLQLKEDDAIAFVTLHPARVLGVDKLIGSIEAGKMADVVVWDRSPLSVYARPLQVFIDGRVAFDRTSKSGRRRSDFELAAVPRPSVIAAATATAETAATGARKTVTGSGAYTIIRGARVHTALGPALEKAHVLMRGDQIVAVGPDVAVPTGATVVDARGAVVTPGFIAAESALGLVEISLEPTARDQQPDKVVGPVRADLRAWDAYNPDSPAVGVTRIEGFTTAIARPFGGLISGQSAAFDLDGLDATKTARVAPVAMHANLGLSGSRELGGSRSVARMRLRQLLNDARLLARSRAKVDSRRYRKLSAPVDQLAALAPVVAGTLPLVIKVNRAPDILDALDFARQQKIRIVLTGAAEAWRVATQIAAARVPVLVEVDRNLPANFDSLGGRFDNAARLRQAGVRIALSAAGEAHNVRVLRQLAGIAVAWGLRHDDAIVALTRGPAEIFGLKERGVIRPGARANVVVWSGDPFELETRVKRLFIGGRDISVTSRQTELRERYR